MYFVWSLLLLVVANGAPIIAAYLFGQRWAWRVDGGREFFDHQPLLGESKTWRGLIAAIVGCWAAALLMGHPGNLGVTFAAYAMLGDLLSSFVKRRLRVPASGKMTGLDQAPEAIFPLLMLRGELGLGLSDVILITVIFILLDQGLSWWLYRWKIRKRPY